MKTLNWNLGVFLIRIGYIIRRYQTQPNQISLRWIIGVFILKYAYKIRGQIPQRTWKK